MKFEAVHVTWIIVAVLYFSCRAWEDYLWAKYPTRQNKSPWFYYSYESPKKSVKKAPSKEPL